MSAHSAADWLEQAWAAQARLASLRRAVIAPGEGANVRTLALAYRDAQVWRIEELARSACDLLDRGDAVAAVVILRALTESVAGLWYLHEALAEPLAADSLNPAALHQTCQRLLLGRRGPEARADAAPEAINVMSFLDAVEDDMPGFERLYDAMSELYHPNWVGVLGHYGARDIDHPGPDDARLEAVTVLGARACVAALSILFALHSNLERLLDAYEARLRD